MVAILCSGAILLQGRQISSGELKEMISKVNTGFVPGFMLYQSKHQGIKSIQILNFCESLIDFYVAMIKLMIE